LWARRGKNVKIRKKLLIFSSPGWRKEKEKKRKRKGKEGRRRKGKGGRTFNFIDWSL
jgi:hypothetical protein